MAIHEDEHDEDPVIETEDGNEPEAIETDAPEGDEDPPEGDDTPEDDDIEISFGDEPAADPEPGANSDLIKQLRAENRRQARELAEARKASTPAPVQLGPKPTMESCEWDEDRFATETEAWISDKAKADAEQQKQRQQQETAAQAWQEELAGFETKKAALKIKDFASAEEEVLTGLSPIQQAIIIRAADDSAKVVYALGKHPQKLADVAKITDPVKFTAAIVKLEGSLKVTTRRQAPAPDRSARGSAPFSAANGKVDAHAEKLEREAAKTGDRTAIIQYRRQLREKEAARSK